jgi:hypothetical protein
MLPFQVAGMMIIGIAGALHERARAGSGNVRSCAETAVMGASLTLVYDVITNLGVASSYALAGTPFHLAIVSAIVSGSLFSLIHVVSNAAVFGGIFVPLTGTLRKMLGGGETWREEPLLT